MPAALPGATLAQNQGNPTQGVSVSLSPFSGPKGSPLDYDYQLTTTVWPPSYANLTTKPTSATGNCSTGQLNTGIGMCAMNKSPVASAVALNGIQTNTLGQGLAAFQIGVSGYTDDMQPGVSLPNNTSATLATLLAIGGGKSTANSVASPSVSNPYLVQPILSGGGGGARDAGAGPAFTGFGMKVVTASGAVAIGAAIEATWLNRTNQAMVSGPSAHGVSNAASGVVS